MISMYAEYSGRTLYEFVIMTKLADATTRYEITINPAS